MRSPARGRKRSSTWAKNPPAPASRTPAGDCRGIGLEPRHEDAIITGVSDPQRSAAISAAEELARSKAGAEPAGHDWWHVHRVRLLALRIARDEGANEFIVEIAALLHEIGDLKAENIGSEEPDTARTRLEDMRIEPTAVDHVMRILADVSFHGAHVPDQATTPEGRCVRDADRLDAIGAIGIARTFAYGGSTRRPIWDPGIAPVLHASADEYHHSNTTTVNHFTEKLLLLRDRMETRLGRTLAAHRHEVMVRFLDELKREWDGNA